MNKEQLESLAEALSLRLNASLIAVEYRDDHQREFGSVFGHVLWVRQDWVRGEERQEYGTHQWAFARNGETDLYWGHYMLDRDGALRDFVERSCISRALTVTEGRGR